MPRDLVFADARLVLPDRILRGSLRVAGGLIAALDDGPAHPPGSIDLRGDYLLPGLIDLHTDNLERQVQPRVAARWPSRSAYLAHDAQCAAAGITTVLDALCVGDLGYEPGRVRTLHDGVADGDLLAAAGVLKAEHFLHLRCELASPAMQADLAPHAGHPALRMVSLMDHTPGFGQYRDLERFRAMRRLDGLDAAAIAALIAESHLRRAAWRGANRDHVVGRLAASGVVLASHDDVSAAEVAEQHAAGVTVSEFPVTAEAARAARALGQDVVAGAPNLVRGGSHSGNVAVAALIADGLVDALASDYVPGSLLEAAMAAADADGIVAGVARVTAAPARIARLDDRGALRVGLRADLVRVHLPPFAPTLPVVRAVWRGGARVA